MVDFLKNFAIGALGQVAKNQETKQTAAIEQADAIRKAKLQLEVNKELDSYRTSNEMAKQENLKQVEYDLKRREQIDTMDLYKKLGEADESIDGPDGQPMETTGDNVEDSYTRQYRMALATGKPDQAMQARLGLEKYRKEKADKDPVRMGENNATTAKTTYDTLIAQGVDEATAKKKAYGVTGNKTVDPVEMRKLRDNARDQIAGYQATQDFSNMIAKDPGLISFTAKFANELGKVTSQTEITDAIATRIGLSDPTQRAKMQEVRTRANLLIGSSRKLIDSGTMSNADRQRLESSLPVLDLFADPASVTGALETMLSMQKKYLEQTRDYLNDPSGQNLIGDIDTMLYGAPQGGSNSNVPNDFKDIMNKPADLPPVVVNTPEEHQKLQPGTLYKDKNGNIARKR